MLYATIAVLFAILLGTSYALNKQTEPPQQDQKQMTPAQQQEMQTRMKNQQKLMMDKEKQTRAEMATRVKAQAALEKEKAEKLAALGVKRKPAGVDISDKWFNETPDGEAGIKQ